MDHVTAQEEAASILAAADALGGDETTATIRSTFAPNYSIILDDPIVKAEGPWLYTKSGAKVFDGVAAYSAANLGHGHPLVREVLKGFLDAQQPTVLGRFLGNPYMALFGKKITEMTGYERFLPANGGVEGPEAAIKLARRWAHNVKGTRGVPEILYAEGCFHGRTTTVTQMFGDDEPEAKDGFGPWAPGFRKIPFNDLAALEAAITENTAAVLIEPIQGEGGINVPDDGYLKAVVELCREKKVLSIFDEVQTGWARTGKLFCWMHEGEAARPDIMAIGKSVSGGFAPVAGILAHNDLMELMDAGSHGSTFGGCPISSAIGYASLVALEKEDLVGQANDKGEYVWARLQDIAAKSPRIEVVRGRGLMFGIEVTKEEPDANKFSKKLLKMGAVIKGTHRWVLRFTPPIVSTKDDLDHVLSLIEEAFTPA
ncbi:MAG: aminotransferase class III-fold pyridoxal phosphate-dependent enzyme [Myxococcota bacterium]